MDVCLCWGEDYFSETGGRGSETKEHSLHCPVTVCGLWCVYVCLGGWRVGGGGGGDYFSGTGGRGSETKEHSLHCPVTVCGLWCVYVCLGGWGGGSFQWNRWERFRNKRAQPALSSH